MHVNAISNNTPAGDGVHAMFLTSAGKGGGVSAGTDSVLETTAEGADSLCRCRCRVRKKCMEGGLTHSL